MIEKVKAILANFTEASVENMSESSELIADLGLNSLDVLNIVVAFEDEFEIEIPDKDIKGFRTIGDIETYLIKKIRNISNY